MKPKACRPVEVAVRHSTAVKLCICLTFILVGTISVGSLPAGQPAGGDFMIVTSTIDGGGGTSAGGDYVLTGTVGQPDASTQTASGGEFALAGGFWAQIGEFFIDLIFGDGFE